MRGDVRGAMKFVSRPMFTSADTVQIFIFCADQRGRLRRGDDASWQLCRLHAAYCDLYHGESFVRGKRTSRTVWLSWFLGESSMLRLHRAGPARPWTRPELGDLPKDPGEWKTAVLSALYNAGQISMWVSRKWRAFFRRHVTVLSLPIVPAELGCSSSQEI